MNKETKVCQNCKQEFTIQPEDFAFYERIQVPPPTWCSECRAIRRMIWRNERSLYKRNCGLCGQGMITMYAPDKDLAVYCRACWLSDKWDPLAAGRAPDFIQPFFEQWRELLGKTPLVNLWLPGLNSNTVFANFATNTKNCYLVYSALNVEDSMYAYAIDDSKEVMDSTYLRSSNLCYENIDSDNIFNSKYLFYSEECIDSVFLFDCINCQNCALSSNLRNARYVFEGRQCTKEEYAAKLAALRLDTHTGTQAARRRFEEVIRGALHKYADILNCINSSGDNLENSKNAKNCYEIYDGENLKFCARMTLGVKDAHDVYAAYGSSLLYESIGITKDSNLNLFAIGCRESREVKYCFNCENSSHLLGCVGLRNKQYCILNKQYSKEEYEGLVPKIIAHMDRMPYLGKNGRTYRYGEFFPAELSPFAYNETLAQEQFPLDRKGALAQGHAWRDPENKDYPEARAGEELPDSIRETGDDILEAVIRCAHGGNCSERCTTAFKIIPAELDFYRRLNISLPRLCPNCRHYGRLQMRNPMRLWERQCGCAGTDSANGNYRNRSVHSHESRPCPNHFLTTYRPGRPESVYCEQCYQAEVI